MLRKKINKNKIGDYEIKGIDGLKGIIQGYLYQKEDEYDIEILELQSLLKRDDFPELVFPYRTTCFLFPLGVLFITPPKYTDLFHHFLIYLYFLLQNL